MLNTTNVYKPSGTKNIALKVFLDDFYSNLNSYTYQKKYSINYNTIFDDVYIEGVSILAVFTRNYNFSNLIKAAQKFVEASKINSFIAGPYICLAWIYFILDDKNTCREYLETAEKVDPNFPNISKIKTFMLNN